ncbi:MAG: hypothetical protein PQJ59_12485 [Spirochaetales bacterium]|nr:hypothetical protein [Spirochaetales bacterium]
MKKYFGVKVSAVIIVLTLLFSCDILNNDDKSSSSNSWDYDSPEEIMDDPEVDNAITETDFGIYSGTNPPNIEGIYTMSGTVVDSDDSSYIGVAMGSEIEFYDQTSSTISMIETFLGDEYYGEGYYITGNYGTYFTTWQTAKVENEYDTSQYYVVVALISGTILSNGDLDGESLSVITQKVNLESYYLPTWWQGEVYLEWTDYTYRSIDEALQNGLIGNFFTE